MKKGPLTPAMRKHFSELGKRGGPKRSLAKTEANRLKALIPPKPGSIPRGRPNYEVREARRKALEAAGLLQPTPKEYRASVKCDCGWGFELTKPMTDALDQGIPFKWICRQCEKENLTTSRYRLPALRHTAPRP